jgi:hypothetical protein
MLDLERHGTAHRLEVVVDIDGPNHMRYRFRIERRFQIALLIPVFSPCRKSRAAPRVELHRF